MVVPEVGQGLWSPPLFREKVSRYQSLTLNPSLALRKIEFIPFSSSARISDLQLSQVSSQLGTM